MAPMYLDNSYVCMYVQKNAKVRFKLADKLIPFLWGIIRSTENFKFLGGWGVLSLDSKNIQRNF